MFDLFLPNNRSQRLNIKAKYLHCRGSHSYSASQGITNLPPLTYCALSGMNLRGRISQVVQYFDIKLTCKCFLNPPAFPNVSAKIISPGDSFLPSPQPARNYFHQEDFETPELRKPFLFIPFCYDIPNPTLAY